MPLNIFKKLQTTATNRFNGNSDFLEAICAGSALMAMADGDASDQEITLAAKSLKANKEISTAFSTNEIDKCMNKMLDIAEGGGRMAKARLLKQIGDVANKDDMAEAVLYAVLDVADHGGIDDSEMAVAQKIADTLGLDLKKFL